MYLVDTDIVVSYLNGRADAVALLTSLLPDGIAMSEVTLGELYEGIYFGADPARHMIGLRHFLWGARVLDVNRRVVRHFGQLRGTLRRQGLLLPAPDLLIAAAALAYDLTLVTRNLRHFQRIPALDIYRQP
jgi:predicted nucleic acid-binding protein